MNIYYVYKIIDPRNNLPIYIGKGKGSRYLSHEEKVKKSVSGSGNLKLYHKIKKILSLGLSPIYEFAAENLEEDLAYELERTLTKEIGLNNLCNLVHGGHGGGRDGSKHSEETKAKMRLAAKTPERQAALRDPERRRKISLGKKGKPRPDLSLRLKGLLGKTWIERFGEERKQQIVEKIVKKTRGRKRTESFKKSQSDRFLGDKNPMFGKKQSEEFKESKRQYFLTDKNPGKNKTPETIQKIKEAIKDRPGRPHSDEQKKAISKRMKEIWRRRKENAKK